MSGNAVRATGDLVADDLGTLSAQLHFLTTQSVSAIVSVSFAVKARHTSCPYTHTL